VAGDPALVAADVAAAARDALPAFGLRAVSAPPGDAAVLAVLGPVWAFEAAAERAGPARSAAMAMRDAIERAARDRFAVGGRRPFELTRPIVMAAVNATPDSFSDGGRHPTAESARDAAAAAFAAGAPIVDVGGESTRPGASPVVADEEIRRVIPVVKAVAASTPAAIVSIDTTKAEVARAAVAAGASIVNDVSGLEADPSMAAAVAELDAAIVIGHRRGDPASMQSLATYADVVAEVVDELAERVDRALAAGVRPDRILVDPGFGFAKRPEHNWAWLRRLAELRSLGYPIVVGPSRKSFLGEATGDGRPPAARDDATLACAVIAALAGAKVVRVHAVPACVDALAVVDALEARRAPSA